MFRNRLRQIWDQGRPAMNGWLSIGNAFTAEIMSRQDYDSLTIDIQHGALDYASVLPMLQAMQASGVTPMVRVPWREPGIIMKALDAGAQGIICPMVNSGAEAAEFVSYLRYPPHGQRSFGPTRATIAYGGYEREEAEARDAKRGVWSSRFERPQDWRAAHPTPHAPRPAPGPAGRALP